MGSLELHLSLNSAQGGLIKGESQSAAHPNEIEIKSFQFAATSPAGKSIMGLAKAGFPSLSELTITKVNDAATPQLYNHLFSNILIKTAKLSASKSTGGSKPEDFVTIDLTGVYVSSIQMVTAADGAETGTETVTLSFQKIEISYKRQGQDGLVTAAGSAAWDLRSK